MSILSENKQVFLGKAFSYIVLLCNLLIFMALFFFKLQRSPDILFFEQHHLYIFLFIITSSGLLCQFYNLVFSKMIGWYAGFILLLSCLILIIEYFINFNYITSFFQINEQASPLTTLGFVLWGYALLDIALSKITWRIPAIAIISIVLASIALSLNILNISVVTPMSLYSALNFLLLAISLIFLSGIRSATPGQVNHLV